MSEDTLVDKELIARMIGVVSEQHAQKFLDRPVILSATVNSVDQDSRTCSVTTINGGESVDLDNVQLMAEVADGLLLIPSIDSTIKIVVTKGLAPFAVQYSDLDKIVLGAGKVFLSMDKTFTLKNELESLATILSDMVTQITKLITNSPNGDGTLSPTSVQAFQSINKRISNLFT